MQSFTFPNLSQSTAEAIAILLGSYVPGVKVGQQRLIFPTDDWSAEDLARFDLLIESLGRVIEAAKAGEINFSNDEPDPIVYN